MRYGLIDESITGSDDVPTMQVSQLFIVNFVMICARTADIPDEY